MTGTVGRACRGDRPPGARRQIPLRAFKVNLDGDDGDGDDDDNDNDDDDDDDQENFAG